VPLNIYSMSMKPREIISYLVIFASIVGSFVATQAQTKQNAQDITEAQQEIKDIQKANSDTKTDIQVIKTDQQHIKDDVEDINQSMKQVVQMLLDMKGE